jgi:hypothetical protein
MTAEKKLVDRLPGPRNLKRLPGRQRLGKPALESGGTGARYRDMSKDFASDSGDDGFTSGSGRANEGLPPFLF